MEEKKDTMKLKKFSPLLRGLAATTAALLTISTVGYNVALSDIAVGWMDGWAGVKDRTIYEEQKTWVDGYTIPGSLEGYSYLKGKNYERMYDTAEDYYAALKAHIVEQGEEGFALLKNDNSALPLASGKPVALFGWNCYNLPKGHTGVVANNSDNITLEAGLKEAGVTLNSTIKAEDFSKFEEREVSGWGGTSIQTVDVYGMESASANYTIPEGFTSKDYWSIEKSTTTAIVAFGRGGGEGRNYMVDDATNANDPLSLSDKELEMVKYAKEHCAKVVVLIVSANAMELGPLVEKGGDYEVDAIGFCGIPNSYHYQGIANVLAGKVNATGGLTDTYLYDNSYNPASINMGQQQYADTATITSFNDPLGRGTSNYYANNYIVESEGIYVGYKYYETRYYDSIVDASGTKATSVKGSSTGEAWDYSNEVIFTFGTSLSYLPYKQTINHINVDLSEEGETVAVIDVKNTGSQDGYFLTQLYVSKPYTSHDVEHKVEKSAIDFLNSKKVKVKAGETETVTISLPTRYLASWDSKARNGKGSYILDEGDYYFTVAAGAHAAVNNVLDAQGHETDGTTTIGGTVTWSLDKLDETTYSMSNGVEVKNQMENADINYYYGEEKVKYLSRSDWDGTFTKNYTNYENDSGIAPEAKFNISEAAKKNEWLIELISAQYKVTPSDNPEDWVELAGTPIAEVQNGTFTSVWAWILNVAIENPEAFNNINSEEWQKVAAAIPLDMAIAATPIGGHATQPFTGIGNPGSVQSESVSGYSQNLKVDGKNYNLAVASNTLLGASFNPELAYKWGVIEGEGGLWLQEQGNTEYAGQAVTVWGAGLNQHRHAYNGRNSEYMSEDPMLTNRIGEAQFRGLATRGAICGPKHMGFNDQELNREGNACYMTEQKVRETDIRCYEGALRKHEGNATGVMMSFARIGATNTTNSVGLIRHIMREEWGFTGIITTDMGKGSGYHEIGALIMSSVNEYASMRAGKIPENTTDSSTVPNAAYITYGDARKDPAFAKQARQTALYNIYTIAHSGSGLYVEEVKNTGEDIVIEGYWNIVQVPVGKIKRAPWENTFIALEIVFGILLGLSGIAWIVFEVLPDKEDN